MKKYILLIATMLIVAATQSSAKKAVVINQVNGQPLVGVEVKIGNKSYITDRFGNLPLGEFTDRPITTYNGIFLNSKMDDNSLVIDFPFTLNNPKKLGKIDGKVLDNNEAVSRKSIVLSKDGFIYNATSDSKGGYNFDYLADGEWGINVPEDSKYKEYNESVRVDGVSKAYYKLDIKMNKLDLEYGSFELTVKDENGIGYVDASLKISGMAELISVNEDGTIYISPIKSGKYRIDFLHKNFSWHDSITIESGKTLKRFSQAVLNYSAKEFELRDSSSEKMLEEVFEFDSGNQFYGCWGGGSGVSNSGKGYNIRGGRAYDTEILVDGLDVGNQFIGGFGRSGEPYTPKVSPSQEIQAGSLTSGEVNDFRKWDMWADIASDELSQYIDTWGIEPTKRYTVQLTSLDNKPVSDAEVHLISQTGETIWSSRSDNTGKAELWADAYKAINDDDNGLSIIVNHKNNKQTITNVTEFKDGINFVRINEGCSHSKNVDIVFAMDATGSMGDEIEYLTTELLDIIERLQVGNDDINFRLGSTFYRDFSSPFEELVSNFDLSSDYNALAEFLKEQSAKGGGDTPEAVEVALSSAVNEFSWSEDAVARIMFLILDAPPHEDPQTMERLRELTARASAMGIRIIPLTASGIGKETEYLMRSLALLTNGTYLFLTDDSGIGGSHIKPTTDSYDVEMMNEMIVRIINQFIDTPNCEDSDDLYAKAIDDNIFNDKEVKGKDIADYIKVYPNPTVGPLTLELEEDFDNLFVVDMNGKILFRVDPKKGTLQINLGEFPSGVYFLKFSYEGAWGSTQIQLRR